MGKRDFIIKYFPFASLYAFEPLLYSTKYAYTSLFKIKGAHQGGAGGAHVPPPHFFCPAPH